MSEINKHFISCLVGLIFGSCIYAGLTNQPFPQLFEHIYFMAIAIFTVWFTGRVRKCL